MQTHSETSIGPTCRRRCLSALLSAVSVSLVALAPLVAAPASSPQPPCAPIHPQRIPHPEGGMIRIIAESRGIPVDVDALRRGAEMWDHTCSEVAPLFHPQGNIRLRIRFHEGANDLEGCGDGCGCTLVNTLPTADGEEYVTSAIIHLFEHYRDGRGDCARHRAESIAHDIGHALGLRDLARPYAPECAGRIMSYTGYRAVAREDCAALTNLWSRATPRPGFGLPAFDFAAD